MEDECLADLALGNMGDELIIDMQSHFANPERNRIRHGGCSKASSDRSRRSASRG